MANFVQVINGEVVGRYDKLPIEWEGKKLVELSSQERKSLGWYSVEVVEPFGWNGETHKVMGPTFTIRENDVLETYTLVELSAEELAQRAASKAQEDNQININISENLVNTNPEVAELVKKLKQFTG